MGRSITLQILVLARFCSAPKQEKKKLGKRELTREKRLARSLLITVETRTGRCGEVPKTA